MESLLFLKVQRLLLRRPSMSTNRGCLANSLLFLVIVLIPVIGHIIETVMLFEDEHTPVGTILWLLVIWSTPILGPLLYLLCLLYTSDAADDYSGVELGVRSNI